MISGRIAFGDLSLEFGDSERRFEELKKEVARLTDEVDKLVASEQELIEELARIYLPDLSPESVSAALTDMRARVEEALTEHAAALADVSAKLAEVPATIELREARVAAEEANEEEAAAVLSEVREAVEQALGQDRDYLEWVAEHRAVMERRSILKTRRTRLLSTANVERFRYEENRAFAYLLGRRWGEADYQAGFLSRWLDGWLARRIGFETLRRNYRILRTGPHAIQAEMRRLTKRAQSLEEELDARHALADEEHGLTNALEAEARAQDALLAARKDLDEVRARRDALAAEMRALEVHRGSPHQAVLRSHADYLEDHTVAQLLELARTTPDPRDDRLAERLGEVRDQLARVEGELAEQTRRLEKTGRKANRLGEVVREVASRFSSRRSYFPESERLHEIFESTFRGDAEPQSVIGQLDDAHAPDPLLAARVTRALDGWFAELSSVFDKELRAVTVDVEGGEAEEHVVVYDANGRLLHRRVTRTKLGDG